MLGAFLISIPAEGGVFVLGSTKVRMATAQMQIPKALEEALVKLRHDPSLPVRARLDELDVELRVVSAHPEEPAPGLGDRMAAAGPWEGETTEELIRILREGRDAGGSAEPPEGL